MTRQFAQYTAPLLGRAMSLLGGPRGLKLLDVGSGYGAVLSAFEPADALPRRLCLMDSNPSLLALAHERAAAAGIAAITHGGAIDALPIPMELRGNDIVLSSFTATHVRDLGAAVAHMSGALRPGGLLALSDVDYCASLASDDEAAEECLWHVQQKLTVRDLVVALPRLAIGQGLRPVPAIDCTDCLQTWVGGDAVRQMALAFVGNFHDDDPAKAAWRRIGSHATVVLRRLAHLYRRT